jgi:hypothetical protein
MSVPDKTDEITENLDTIKTSVRKLVEDRTRLSDMLDEAIETTKRLTNLVPKLVSKCGGAMCKIAESVLPGENVLIIKMNPTKQTCTIHILEEKEDITLADVEFYLANAHRVAQYMENEDGFLVPKHEKAIN